MKRSILFLSFLLFGLNSFSQSKKELRDEFITGCMGTAVKEGDDEAMVKIWKSYCECSADIILEKFTLEEIEQMESWTKEESEKKLTPVIKVCTDKLIVDMEAKEEE